MLYSIVLTVLNEEQTLEKAVTGVEEALGERARQSEVIIVDDGSCDTSLEIALGLRERYGNLLVIGNGKNMGRGHALREGIRAAKGKIVGIMDTDLQYSPTDLARALEEVKAGRADLVCGWRCKNENNPARRILSLGFNSYCRTLFPMKIHDANSGIKAGKKEMFEKMPLCGGAYRLVAARASGKYRLGEIRIQHRARMHGKSRIPTPRIFIETLKEMLKATMDR